MRLHIQQQQISPAYEGSEAGAVATPARPPSMDSLPIQQDWERHKSSCKLYTEVGNSASNESKLQRHLRLWTARFDSSLTCAIVPALDLQNNPTNIDTHGLIIRLQPRKHSESGSRFTLQSATVVPMAQLKLLYEAAGGNAVFQEHARQRAALQKKSGGREDYATMLVIAQNTGDDAFPGDRFDTDMRCGHLPWIFYALPNQLLSSFKPIFLTISFIQSPQFRDPSLAWRETLMIQVENDIPNRIVI
ncbi:hypothetical protein BT96DRAFT_988648 [Gymnopus androsaceus JB14]|uniref:Uncharacterized protein n=1 Tax=Gymnopus androsaceus JB14 TaxID=1447944 RepID=A0A6A4I8Q9_9AGAR|nr:hypothetical protein BT96DRAFT_988648 [Gymnopus androsaceus JB14]